MKKKKKTKSKNPFEKEDKQTERIFFAIIILIALIGLVLGYMMITGLQEKG